MLEQPVPEGRHPVGKTHAGESFGQLSPVRGTPPWRRGTIVGSPPPEEEGSAETM